MPKSARLIDKTLFEYGSNLLRVKDPHLKEFQNR